jgi:hypothetical protein
VKRAVERPADSGVITLPPLVEVSNDGPGPSTVTEYRVGKRDSVKQTIERLAEKVVISQPQIEDGEKSSNDVTKPLHGI